MTEATLNTGKPCKLDTSFMNRSRIPPRRPDGSAWMFDTCARNVGSGRLWSAFVDAAVAGSQSYSQDWVAPYKIAVEFYMGITLWALLGLGRV